MKRFFAIASLLTVAGVSRADNITLGVFGSFAGDQSTAPGMGIGQCAFSACNNGPASYGVAATPLNLTAAEDARYDWYGPNGELITSINAPLSPSEYSLSALKNLAPYGGGLPSSVVIPPPPFNDQPPSIYSNLPLEQPSGDLGMTPGDPVPEPSTIWLVFSGLIAFALLRRGWAREEAGDTAGNAPLEIH
jgi:hypothetical protein